MENWIKIQSFQRLHQAELRKDILEQNNIEAVIINEKDSLFLVGDVELFVKSKDEKKAKALIDQFNGLTKVNSFIEEKPVKLFQQILAEAGIESELVQKQDDRYLLDNFELYIDNDKVESTLPYLTGKKINNWSPVRTTRRVRQAKLNITLLTENGIDAMVIKKKDTDFHLEEVLIYVENVNAAKADKILTELNGWIRIKENMKFNEVAKHEEILASQLINSIIVRAEENNYDLYTEASNEETAIDTINTHRDWTLLRTYKSSLKAMYHNDILAHNDIPATMINEKDSSFIIGSVELHVQTKNREEAIQILESLETQKPE